MLFTIGHVNALDKMEAKPINFRNNNNLIRFTLPEQMFDCLSCRFDLPLDEARRVTFERAKYLWATPEVQNQFEVAVSIR